ncbi:MAG: hypothetical protein FRX49_00742 [Trebouxia sp. A1-2]|nr:MAG: hypothetical protein FRX49_00742 [Trebouxia sp. A1-2]
MAWELGLNRDDGRWTPPSDDGSHVKLCKACEKLVDQSCRVKLPESSGVPRSESAHREAAFCLSVNLTVIVGTWMKSVKPSALNRVRQAAELPASLAR